MRRSKVPILCALLLLLAVLGAACGDDGEGDDDPAATSLADPGGELDLDEAARLTLAQTEAQVAVGDLVVVELDENPSVGDLWQVAEDPDADVLALVEEAFEIDDPESDGGGGVRLIIYEAVGGGGTTFTLENCFRCTSEGEPSETPPEPAEVSFSVEVAG